MRAVNLLPPDTRGASKVSADLCAGPEAKGGAGPFVVLGVLAACVAGAAGYVLTDNTVKQRAKTLGKDVVLWTIDSRDWTKPGTAAIVQRVLKGVHNGSVILLHDGGGNRSPTVAALPTILKTLKAKGYGFRTLSC